MDVVFCQNTQCRVVTHTGARCPACYGQPDESMTVHVSGRHGGMIGTMTDPYRGRRTPEE